MSSYDIYTEFATPPELTGYARAALADRPENALQLAQFLPYRSIPDLNFRFSRDVSGLTEAAAYRAWDAEPGFGRREGLARVSGSLPPLGRQMLLNEFDQIVARNGNQEVRDHLFRDAGRLGKQVDARLELARADALVNGSVSLAEEGVHAAVDFGRDPAHHVTASTPWSDLDDSDPISDMDAWLDVYNDSNGRLPGTMLTSTRVQRLLRRNKTIQAAVYPGNSNFRLTNADVNAYMADQGWPPVTTYDVKFRVNKQDQRVIPEDLVLLLPAPVDKNDGEGSDMGATLLGTTLEAQEPSYGFAESEMPGVVVGAFKQTTTPIQVVTIIAAIGIPIMANPNLSFVADVL